MKKRRFTDSGRVVRRASVALVAVCAVLVGVGGFGGAETARAATCALSSGRAQLVFLPSSGMSESKICGVLKLENDAYDMYARTHGRALDDPKLAEDGQYQIAGIMWQLLEQITLNVESGVPVTSFQQGAYQWLKDLVYDYRLGAAQKAIDEYNKWKNAPCVYVPPSTDDFTYRGSETLACRPGQLASLLRGPTPPQLEEFIAYGMYDQRNTLALDRSGNEQYAHLERQGIAEGAAIWADLTVSAAPSALYQLPGGVTTFQRFAQFVSPTIRKPFNKALRVAGQKAGKYARNLVNLLLRSRLQNGARILWGVADDAAEEAIKQAARVGLRLARFGVTHLSTVLGAAAFLADVLEAESEEIKRQQELLPKLQANLASVKPDLKPFLLDSAGDGNTTAFTIFQAQLQLADPAHGVEGHVVNTFPDDGTRLRIGYERDTGGVSYTELLPTVQIAAWPLGAGQGALGVPKYTVGVSDGKVWHTPSPDEEDLGLTGYLPSGEIRYFDWSGHQRIALVVGDKFLDLPGPGSIDMGNLDAAADRCDTDSACGLRTTIFALKHAKGVDAAYTLVTQDADAIPLYHPSDGSLKPPFWKIRLSLVPDTGTPPGTAIYNQYGNDANAIRTGPPNGGLVAGETVQVTSPSTHPAGFATTYTWHIETRCAYDPAHPTQVIEGVPTCYGDSDYGHATLGQQDRDLLVGCPDACAPDPAFHGNPVQTVTGQSVPFTWPAPGTYHIRLITKDSFGATRQSDRNVVVVGDQLNVPLSATPGWVSPSVIGPVRNGSAFTIKGCIQNATMPYADPEVTVDWGDGVSQTYTGSGGGALTFGATTSCSSPWSFSLTHAYNLTPPSGTLLLQKSVTLTITDGFGHTLTLNPYVNVIFNSAPQITSADATTFAAGTSGFFTFKSSGGPTPSLAITSGSLPTGVGFLDKGDGTATLEGSANINSGGEYPLTITATNSEGTDTQDFVLTVNVAPSFTSDASRAMTAGDAGTITFQTSGFPAPGISVDAVDGPGSGTALPSGVTFTDNGDGTATLSGTPDAASVGTYHLTMKATSAAGTAFQAFTLVVASLPAFTSASTVSWRTGASPTSFTITTSGSPAPDLDYSGSLPSGLGFADNNDGTGVIFGSTTASGTFHITLSATNAAGTGTQDLTINASTFGGPDVTFSGPNWVSADIEARFTEGLSGSVTITRSDGSGSLVLEGTPPSGLTFTDNGDGTATLSGTPAAGTTGNYGLKVTADDGFAFLSVLVAGPPSITSDSTAHFTVGSTGSFKVTTAGVPRAALSETGALPDGLSFTDTGFGSATIAGTPTAAGASTIALKAENILGTAESNLTIEVDQAPTITSDSSAAFGEGVAQSFDVTTSGFPVPALNVQGALPPGVVFTDDGDGTGKLSGTPTDTTIKTYPFTIVATSTAGTTSQSFNLEVGPRPAFSSSLAATFTTGKAGSFVLSADGVPTPTLALVSALPTGLSFSDNGDGTATIAGTPAAGQGGLRTVQVKATNKYGSLTKGLALAVNQKPSFLGTRVGLTCANVKPPAAGGDSALFTADSLNSWTLCMSGYPPGSSTLAGALPQGVSFVDNGDGTATIAGTAAIGTGGTYPLTLKMSNPAGNNQQTLTLNVVEDVRSTSEPDRPIFVAGQPNSYQLSAVGKPIPSFSVLPGPDPLPAWLTLTDNGDGTATLAGTPPPAAAGSDLAFGVREENGTGNGFVSDVFLTITDLGFTAASPPHATAGRPYSYSFAATSPGATFSVADGAKLPTGLTFSPSGVLSGTPTTVARWRFSVIATVGGSSARTAPIEFVVDPAPHQLQVSKFRLVGPTGESDWFVELTNTTDVAMPLAGWMVRVPLEGTDETFPIELGFGTLAAHASLVMAGPFSSLPPLLTVNLRGTPRIGEPGGFAVVAPDGTVTDKAGEVGVAAELREGLGVVVPEAADKVRYAAFVRRVSGGVPVDTNDNAHDFRYINLSTATPAISTTASAGVVLGSGQVSDTATLAGGAAPTGSVTFTLYGPDDADCSGTPVFTTTKSGVSGPGSYTSASFATTKAGTYRWIASYSGDSDNGPVSGACNDPGESVVVAKARPTLTTKASAGVLLGGLVRDTATLAGGVRPTGKITFRLYGKSDTSCTNLPVFTTSRSVFDNGSFGSATFLPRRPATYRWIASYSGDQNNEPVTGRCNDPNEAVSVSRARPVLTTKASPDVALGGRIRDTANLARGFSPTGKIVFRLYGPNDSDCSRAPVFTTARIVSGNGTYVSAAFTPSRKGTYRWVASYRGDIRNEPISHGCNAAYESVVVS